MNSPINIEERLFRFKQFSITDKGCGMKIGTDGVLLGAIATRYKSIQTLDVGTGCGLIALILAQKSAALITAIEIDEQAAETARLNVINSPWASRIKVVNQSFQDFHHQSTIRYDLIVCNPPFFHNSHLTSNPKRSLARHSDTLRPAELLSGASKIISDDGRLLVIIPFDKEPLWYKEASKVELFFEKVIRVLPRKGVGPKRSIIEISKKSLEKKVEILIIEEGKRHTYSPEYIELTRDYYLNM